MDINSIIRRVIQSLEQRAVHPVQYELHLAEDLEQLPVTGEPLDQLVRRLCIRAERDLPLGGRIVFETRSYEFSKSESNFPPRVPSRRGILIGVEVIRPEQHDALISTREEDSDACQNLNSADLRAIKSAVRRLGGTISFPLVGLSIYIPTVKLASGPPQIIRWSESFTCVPTLESAANCAN
jgi:hypothetical protein